MGKRIMSDHRINAYCLWLYQDEKSCGTIQKYHYYLKQFQEYLGNREISRELLLQWKNEIRKHWSAATVNGALAALNGFLRYAQLGQWKVKLLKRPRQMFCAGSRELTRSEYEQLVRTAQAMGNERMAMLLQTVCSTGIRISELSFITVEALERRCADVDCKGKIRKIFLTDQLCRILKAYVKARGITNGMIFITRSGRTMDRSNIWREMKRIATQAGICREKVFPHNLRHLFARVYYGQEKDLLRLSDILGHSSVDTTRIYTMESGENHIRQLEHLGLVIGCCNNNRIPLLL